jgi:hypothetical protein
MQIPKELLEKWKSLRSRGDTAGILQIMGLKPDKKDSVISAISRTFKDERRRCPDHLFMALRTFYEGKEKKLFTNKNDENGK